MKSFIKIYGPPVLKAIKTLEKMSIDMPQVCIMDVSLKEASYDSGSGSQMGSIDISRAISFFGELGDITKERCSKIISKSGEELGDYDFFFKWFNKPNQNELNKLIEKVDEVLTPLGVRYTITTK